MSKELNTYEPDTLGKAISKSLEAPEIDPVLLAIANESLAGTDITEISEKFNVPRDLIVQILDKKEVANYMNTVMLNQGYLNRAKRLKLINDVIIQKIQDAVESGVYSKKDLLDWIKHLHEVEQAVRPKENIKQGSQTVTNYEVLLDELYEGNK